MSRLIEFVVRRSGMAGFLREAWLRDVRSEWQQTARQWKKGPGREVANLSREMARLQKSIAELNDRLQEVDGRQRTFERQATRTAVAAKLDAEQQDLVAKLPEMLDAPRILEHVRAAVAKAPLLEDPFPHCLVSDVLPRETYRLMRRAIPPVVFFGDADPIKQNLRIPIDKGPALATQVWHFVDDVVAHQGIVPVVMQRFAPHLARHYAAVFGPAFVEQAAALPQAPSGGRVMLRRPGYRLAPHRDPKRAVLTCLLYLANWGDDEAYGTELYRVHGEQESSYVQTYYPEQDGARCELVARVPYRPNSMLVFINGTGAHGAHIPADAPASLERFAYQFYVGPSSEDLAALVAALPDERRLLWRDKAEVAQPNNRHPGHP
jgi:hypothetical protein